ncbi:MAG TPA: hypothetical protein VNZ86_10065 [Bacteroidia bacterium]|jgi:hypothetical protein|nr:hypothetical protein [Bacteroidia bacterium]
MKQLESLKGDLFKSFAANRLTDMQQASLTGGDFNSVCYGGSSGIHAGCTDACRITGSSVATGAVDSISWVCETP